MKKNIIALLTLCAFMLLSACTKLAQIDSPITRFDAEKVYNKDATATAVLTGIYQEMSADGLFQGTGGFSLLLGLSADELTDYSGGNTMQTFAYQNMFVGDEVPFWQRLYRLVYTTNSAINGINESQTLSAGVKKQLLGEAKFMRAFFYFQLTNLWGDVPLVLTTDYKENSSIKRSSQTEVYKQIVSDLQEAESLLSTNYVLSDLKTVTEERIRPTSWVAKALLAKVYLYTKQYTKAAAKATEIISHEELFNLPVLNDVFLNTSREAIWQIQSINPAINTYEAKSFVLSGAPNGAQPVSLSDFVLEAFMPGDQRRIDWVGEVDVDGTIYKYANKYKLAIDFSEKKECLMVFRLGEQYLVRAEAKAESGDIAGAVADINKIKTRARAAATVDVPNPLPDLSAGLSIEQIREALLLERQAELFTEWGSRWYDLKRTGQLNDVMAAVSPGKGSIWESYKALFPIPASELVYNRNLTQNPGY